MSKIERSYARYTREAIQLLANQIRATRIEKKITAQMLADRINISRGLLSRLEKGDPSCSIGVYFEAACILGIALFQSDYADLSLHNKLMQDKLTLLPASVKPASVKVNDDF